MARKKKLNNDFIVKYKEVTGINLLSRPLGYHLSQDYSRQNEELNERYNFLKENHLKTHLSKQFIDENSDRVLQVPFVSIVDHENYILNYDRNDFIIDLRTYPLMLNFDPRGAEWRYFEIQDDSMEPEFLIGDIVLASLVPKMDWKVWLQKLYSHIIVTTNKLWIRRLYSKDGKKLILVSSNKKYEPIPLDISEVNELWFVRALHRNHINNEPELEDKDILKKIKMV